MTQFILKHQWYSLLLVLSTYSQTALAEARVLSLNPDSYMKFHEIRPYLEVEAHDLKGSKIALEPSVSERVNFGFDPNVIITMRLRLRNASTEPIHSVLRFGERLIPELPVLVESSLRPPQTLDIGFRAVYAKGSLPTVYVTYPLDLAPGESLSLQFTLQNAFLLNASFDITSRHRFIERAMLDLSVNVASLFLVFAIALYSALLAILSRQKILASYAAFVFFTGLTLSNVMGYTNFFMHLTPISLMLRTANLSITAMLLGIVFGRAYLKLATLSPSIDRCLKYWTIIIACLYVVVNLPATRAKGGYLVDLALILTGLMLLSLAAFAARRGMREGFVYLGSWSVFLIGVMILIAARQGLILRSPLTDYAMHLGLCLKALTLITLLSLDMRRLQQESLEASRRADVMGLLASEKQRVVRVLAHDLSNPLSIVHFMAKKNLKNSQLSEDDKKSWQKVGRAAEHMTSMISIVRYLEATESGKHSLKASAVSLADLFQELAESFELRLREKQVELQIMLAKPDLSVIADRTLLFHSVLGNLISNAIKFSPQGSKVHLAAEQRDNEVVLTVKDHGQGISAEKRLILFDSQKATTSAGTQAETGTGFGLPIAAAFTEKMGGRITLESKTEQDSPSEHGTEFHVHLKAA